MKLIAIALLVTFIIAVSVWTIYQASKVEDDDR